MNLGPGRALNQVPSRVPRGAEGENNVPVARRGRIAAVILVLIPALAGCSFTGLNSYPLPFTQGHGTGSSTVRVEMDNVVNLVPNSDVKVGDVTVGVVRSIQFNDWHAMITVGLNPGVRLPANARARIGQKSLLGAEYLQLDERTGERPVGQLRDGDLIPLAHTGRYPETEEVLSALALTLNGGGLNQLHTINHELNQALDGHQSDTRDLLTQLDTFIGGLNDQKADLVATLQGLDRLSGTFAAQNQAIDHALTTIPDGLKTLNDERQHLLTTLHAVADFSRDATPVLRDSQDNLVADLHNLQPVLRRLADSGPDLTQALGALTVVFPTNTVPRIFKGDYANLLVTLDLRTATLGRNFLAGTPLETLLGAGPLAGPATGPATESGNPLLTPLLPPAIPPAAPPSSPLGGSLDPLLGGGR
jgi:phospholipid/cholesterol/gamma-HCH transport system substrate-binding protein